MNKLKRTMMLLKLMFQKNGMKRAEYIKKHKLFYGMGEHCYWHPYKIPHEGYLMNVHNNVCVAANVTFITHDVMEYMFRYRGRLYV